MTPIQLIALLAIFAFVLSWIIYPAVYRYAQKHKMVDIPNQRKLQKQPTPLLGGCVVALAIIIPWIISALHFGWSSWYITICFIVLSLLLGLLDDIYELPAMLRFIVEIILVGAYIILSHSLIDNFNGLWNLQQISSLIAIPLSILAGVGIINSINLIDGIDGYSSGFGIISCTLFGVFFLHVQDWTFAGLVLIVAAAMVPFFYYNLFSKNKKMFIGDCGTLMLGAIMAVAVFRILSKESSYTVVLQQNMGLVALCIAVLCIPIFDTIRVMSERLLRGVSPFTADKTHLHHLFLEHQLSHLQTTIIILSINLVITTIWYISYRLKVSIDIQLYLVVALGILFTFGLSAFLRKRNK